jgi:hypothetical protein
MVTPNGNLLGLFEAVIGARAAQEVVSTLALDAVAAGDAGAWTPRLEFAIALNGVLFHDLLLRAPTGAAYVGDRRAADEKIVFDHGALRTILFADGPTGELPGGVAAFTRILEPLGYRFAGLYPLDRLKMTGRAFAHAEAPEAAPQFFISERHVDRFSPEFQAAAHRVFDSARDPLGAEARAALDAFAREGRAPLALAKIALTEIVAAFARTHEIPSLADYQQLKAESKEAAWIATEGAVFNHATDRVVDVEATADLQRRLGRPVKEAVEVSGSGRVRQTAFRADAVMREFRDEAGAVVLQEVPGSFFEFITRDIDPETQGLDLRFDSSNAQGIFKMTAGVA